MATIATSYQAGHRDSTVVSHRQAVERVIRAMYENLDERLSLEDMAEVAISSPYHFNRVFRQIVGIPPIQFLYALRLQRAKRLLLTTDLSVTDVCFEVGYNSLGSFTKRFTGLVGVSPSRLRRLASDEGLFAGLEDLFRQGDPRPPAATPSVAGRISAATPFEGPIFVGLFTKRIPQGQPVSGTLITAPGDFAIDEVPPGRYHLFAAGFPWPDHPMGYLLPNTADLQVGVSRGPVQVREGATASHADVAIRPVMLTDPPILIALPLLIAEFMATNGAAVEEEEEASSAG